MRKFSARKNFSDKFSHRIFSLRNFSRGKPGHLLLYFIDPGIVKSHRNYFHRKVFYQIWLSHQKFPHLMYISIQNILLTLIKKYVLIHSVMCHIYKCARPNKTGTKLPNFSLQSFTHLSIDSLVMKHFGPLMFLFLIFGYHSFLLMFV